MDTGKDKRSSQQRISGSWGAASKENITYFRYTGDTYTSRQYKTGTPMQEVKVTGKGNVSQRLKPIHGRVQIIR